MYKFIIKDKGPDLDIVITRALLALAAIATLVYRTNGSNFLTWLSFLLLLAGAIFIKRLVESGISKLVLLVLGAITLFFATHSLTFAFIILIYGCFVKFLYKKPSVSISKQGIKLERMVLSPFYQWGDFSNVILKDSLLTLDFKNNKLLQLDIDEDNTNIPQEEFNAFCAAHL